MVTFFLLQINTYGYSIIPFVLLALFNSLLVYTTYTHKAISLVSCKLKKKQLKSMTTLIAVRTLFFIICTAPIAIAGGYFINDLRSSDIGNLCLSIFNVLRFSHHSFNIFVLTAFNHKFREKMSSLRKGKLRLVCYFCNLFRKK
jgi:hypothetical protein